jgi:hypothetical protein
LTTEVRDSVLTLFLGRHCLWQEPKVQQPNDFIVLQVAEPRLTPNRRGLLLAAPVLLVAFVRRQSYGCSRTPRRGHRAHLCTCRFILSEAKDLACVLSGYPLTRDARSFVASLLRMTLNAQRSTLYPLPSTLYPLPSTLYPSTITLTTHVAT